MLPPFTFFRDADASLNSEYSSVVPLVIRKTDSTRAFETRRSKRQLLSAFMYYLHSSVPTASALTRAFEQRVLVVC